MSPPAKSRNSGIVNSKTVEDDEPSSITNSFNENSIGSIGEIKIEAQVQVPAKLVPRNTIAKIKHNQNIRLADYQKQGKAKEFKNKSYACFTPR